MLLTPHILVGAAIITKVPNPTLGLIFVFLSHYFLDLFPQTEYSIKNIRNGQWPKSLPDFLKVFLDIALGFGIVFSTVGYSPLVFIAVFVAILPDGFTLLHAILPTNSLLKTHMKMHAAINLVCQNKKLPVSLGVISQTIVAILTIFLLL